MTEIAQSIELNLPEKLQNREYRQKFFLAEASADIAKQLIALRKRRGLDQGQLAKLVGTQQPAISRIEKADYQNWSFNSLRKIAAAEDARIRVTIQAAEDVLYEYETQSELVPVATCNYDPMSEALRGQSVSVTGQIMIMSNLDFVGAPLTAATNFDFAQFMANLGRYSLVSQQHWTAPAQGRRQTDREKIVELEAEVAQLKNELAEAKKDLAKQADSSPFGQLWKTSQTLTLPIGIPTP